MTASDTVDPLIVERRAFRARLEEYGWLIPSQSAVLPGLGTRAVAVYDGLAATISRAAREAFAEDVTPLRFPPVVSTRLLEKTGYVASFPQLLGTIDSFHGGQTEFRELITEYDRGGDWQASLSATGLALVSAACHPLFASLQDTTAEPRNLYEVTGECFRHEPSEDPMRLVSFRMREYVRLGTEGDAKEHRRRWLEIARQIFAELQVPVEVVPANDPFFGRGGAVLAANQIAAEAKLEIVTEIYEGTQTAITSGNVHGDHFGADFAISLPDGTVAQSACIGFGMERIVFALVRHHGASSDAWPTGVRTALGLTG